MNDATRSEVTIDTSVITEALFARLYPGVTRAAIEAAADDVRDVLVQAVSTESRVSPSVIRSCLCVAEHRPAPMAFESHHIWPLGMGGPDVAANRVWLCPTAHTNAHEILRELMRYGPMTFGEMTDLFPVQVSRYAYSVAVAGHTSWLTSSPHTL